MKNKRLLRTTAALIVVLAGWDESVAQRPESSPANPLVVRGAPLAGALAVLPHVSVVLTSLSETGAWYKSVLPTDFTGRHYFQALEDELALPSVLNSIRPSSAKRTG